MKYFMNYSGIKTKVKAMSLKLISANNYQILANIDNVVDFILFLKNHPGYQDILQQYDEQELHRADVERLFINGLYMDYTKIYRFANNRQREYLDLLFFRYEINILKACIRLIYTKDNAYDLALFQSFFEKHSKINISKLRSSRSVAEYVQNLKGTKYYSLLSSLQNKLHTTSFDYEMQLDIFYFKKAWKLIENDSDLNNINSFKRRLGTEIDLSNIMWIFRARSIFHMESTEIFPFIIPVNYKLSKEDLLRLSGSNTMDEFLSYIHKSYYQAIGSSLINGTIEAKYNEIVFKVYKLNNIRYPSSMAYVNFYLHQKELEINRLTTALECIRYGLTPQEKLKYIIQ